MSSTKVVTSNEVRLSYTNLLTPRAQNEEKPDELTYSSAILIPKSDEDTIKAIQKAIKAALDEGVQKKWGGKRPSNLRNPLRDGDDDRPDDPVYAGHMFINAKGPRGGQEQPILLDSKGNETDSVDVIYSGVYARVSIQFYPYDRNGNRGVACGITSVLSGEHGDPLGNTVTAASARSEFGIATPAESAKAAFSEPQVAADSDDDEDDPWSA